ncbi:MAG: PDZ domain-containing protein [Gammaproteobacteria bacterium]|nr:PDZ domain-containing protein [Gammaproteobacteria bacterium]MDE2345120.1 PDZ domain-containing protein [Gammaproteobacteria bacterium]
MASLFQQTVDDALLKQARRGDSAAQAQLFSLFGRPVYTLARQLLVDSQLAEDILQGTFVEVLRNLRDFRGDAPLGMWIRRIAVNRCLAHLRSSWRRLLRELQDAEVPDTRPVGGHDRDMLDLQHAPADSALKLQGGDVILKIGTRDPGSPPHAMRILGSYGPGETVPLTILRKGKQLKLNVKLPHDAEMHGGPREIYRTLDRDRNDWMTGAY